MKTTLALLILTLTTLTTGCIAATEDDTTDPPPPIDAGPPAWDPDLSGFYNVIRWDHAVSTTELEIGIDEGVVYYDGLAYEEAYSDCYFSFEPQPATETWTMATVCSTFHGGDEVPYLTGSFTCWKTGIVNPAVPAAGVDGIHCDGYITDDSLEADAAQVQLW